MVTFDYALACRGTRCGVSIRHAHAIQSCEAGILKDVHPIERTDANDAARAKKLRAERIVVRSKYPK
jgi:hypothetical protein